MRTLLTPVLLVLFCSRVAGAQPVDAPTPTQPPSTQPAPHPPAQPETGVQQPPSPALESAPSPPAYPGPEAPPARFGGKGQWAILATSTSAGISSRTFNASAASFLNANIAIGIDMFLAHSFSLGIDLEASYGDDKGYGASSLTENTSTYLAGGLRFGLNVPLGGLWSWYPRVTLGVEWSQSDIQTISESAPGTTLLPSVSTSKIGPWVNAYAPLLVHPVQHFFIGVGPRFEHNFGSIRGGPYDRSTTFNVNADFVVGGWWGGFSDRAAENRAPEAPARITRFGEKGQLVLTSATTASVASVTYSNSSASRLGATIAPGFDYFVTEHFSVGADISFSYMTATEFDAGGTPTDVSETSFGVGPRLGVDFPLVGEWLSLWPQVELGFGTDNVKVNSPVGSNEHEIGRTWIQASAPLLVHVAPHFFLGAGPFVSHDLSSTDQNHFENDGTSVGASFLLGGWL